jgi:four helix bundle protein
MAKRYEQDIRERAFRLAARVFALFPGLAKRGQGHALLARQLLKATSGMAAQLEEAAAASSRRDMKEKYSIGLREAREGLMWTRLLATDPNCESDMAPLIAELGQFVAMMTTAVKRLKGDLT